MSTIDRALSLLNHFSESTPEMGLAQFKTLSGFDKGTVHRYLKSLKDSGFLEQNPISKTYRLGPALVRLAHIRENTVPVSKVATAHVDALANETLELVHASVPQSKGMSTIYLKDGDIRGTRVGFDMSEILPFHATSSGMVMLAFGPPEILEGLRGKLLSTYTDATATNFDDLLAGVKIIQKNGYAFSNQTFEAEVSSLAVPFFDGSEIAAGTLAIATPTSRIGASKRKTFAAGAMAASRKITRDLGGQIPEHIHSKWARVERAFQEASRNKTAGEKL